MSSESSQRSASTGIQKSHNSSRSSMKKTGFKSGISGVSARRKGALHSVEPFLSREPFTTTSGAVRSPVPSNQQTRKSPFGASTMELECTCRSWRGKTSFSSKNGWGATEPNKTNSDASIRSSSTEPGKTIRVGRRSFHNFILSTNNSNGMLYFGSEAVKLRCTDFSAKSPPGSAHAPIGVPDGRVTPGRRGARAA
jgi:hypothetical protein